MQPFPLVDDLDGIGTGAVFPVQRPGESLRRLHRHGGHVAEDDPRAIEIKCKYILDNDLLGAMYWEYTCDDAQGTLRKIVTDYMMGQKGLDYQQAPAEHYVPTDTTAPAPKPAPAIPAN